MNTAINHTDIYMQQNFVAIILQQHLHQKHMQQRYKQKTNTKLS